MGFWNPAACMAACDRTLFVHGVPRLAQTAQRVKAPDTDVVPKAANRTVPRPVRAVVAYLAPVRAGRPRFAAAGRREGWRHSAGSTPKSLPKKARPLQSTYLPPVPRSACGKAGGLHSRLRSL